MSLCDVLAASSAARNLVLLGDPQQLEQPHQGSHPEGTDLSALEHILAEHKTMPETQGLFLEETYRLYPDLCRFTSEQFYEGRLEPRPGLERQRVLDGGAIQGSGLWYLPQAHDGNVNSSGEEVEAIRALVNSLVLDQGRWQDSDGVRRKIELSDILIVAPCNAQVAALKEALPGAKVGTVDKFQGQQAAVVIYSMTTSSPEEPPGGWSSSTAPIGSMWRHPGRKRPVSWWRVLTRISHSESRKGDFSRFFDSGLSRSLS